MAYFDCNDPESAKEAAKKMREMFGAGQVDQMFRHAIQYCWMAPPDDRKTFDELEKQIKRLVDRAIRDMKEDIEQFGFDK